MANPYNTGLDTSQLALNQYLKGLTSTGAQAIGSTVGNLISGKDINPTNIAGGLAGGAISSAFPALTTLAGYPQYSGLAQIPGAYAGGITNALINGAPLNNALAGGAVNSIGAIGPAITTALGYPQYSSLAAIPSTYAASTVGNLLNGMDLSTSLTNFSSGVFNPASLGLNAIGSFLPEEIQPVYNVAMASGIPTQVATMGLNSLAEGLGLGTELFSLGSGITSAIPIVNLALMAANMGYNIYTDMREDEQQHRMEKDQLAQTMVNYKQNEEAYDYFFNQALGDYIASGGITDQEMYGGPGVNVWNQDEMDKYLQMGGSGGLNYLIEDPVLKQMIDPNMTNFQYEQDPLGYHKGAQLGFSTSPAINSYYDPTVITQGIAKMLSGELTPEQIQATWESYGIDPDHLQGLLNLGLGWNQYQGPIQQRTLDKIAAKSGVEIDPFVYMYMMQKQAYDQEQARKQADAEYQALVNNPAYINQMWGVGY